MTAYHLAQYNIAWLVAPLDAPQLADFNANLERVNLLAEQSSGFVWRYKDDSGNSTGTRVRDDERILVNFSAWDSAEALFEYAFHSGHADMYRRRREWFTHEDEPYAVLWWIPIAHPAARTRTRAHLRARQGAGNGRHGRLCSPGSFLGSGSTAPSMVLRQPLWETPVC